MDWLVVLKVGLVVVGGLGWSLGGEKYFGRWRRGAVLLLQPVVLGLVYGFPWWAFGFMFLASYFAYQMLSYDRAIYYIYDKPVSAPGAVFWNIVLFGNGLLCGIVPSMYLRYRFGVSDLRTTIVLLYMGLGFPFICWLSNRLKISIPICIRHKEVKVFCPADSWWFACWIYGIMLAVLYW